MLGPRLDSVGSQPTIRVRLERARKKVRVESDSAIGVGPVGQGFDRHARRFVSPLRIERKQGRFIISGGGGRAIRWRLEQLRLTPTHQQLLEMDQGAFPGSIVLASATHSDSSGSSPPSRFDLINHVPLERYLPGVLEHELYPKWPAATYRAQAIAARSYALWERRLQRKRHPARGFDLEASQASQVYGGSSTHRRALEATRATRGVVLGYQGRVVPAFFSSTCGGAGQDAAVAFPDRAPDITPLRGRVRGKWCTPSTKYRWGPVTRQVTNLTRRIRAWGRANDHRVANIARLKRVGIMKRSRTNRPAVFGLMDRQGRRFTLIAEDFRMACNFAGAGLDQPDPNQRLYSSNVHLTLTGDTVRFTNGRGFGHGVGLCQWGAMTLAREGHGAAAICRYYYPGARLMRLY